MKRAIAYLALSLVSATSVMAALEVRLLGGRSLLVDRVEYDGSTAILTLVGGGRLVVDRERIAAVASLPSPPVAEDLPPPQADAPAPGEPASAPPESPPAEAPLPPLPLMNMQESGGYGDLIAEAALRHDVDAELLRCLLMVESGFDPGARSPKGAMGLAQLMPGTASDLGVADPYDPVEAVDAAARLLGRLLRENEGRFVPALAAYNAGPGAVSRYGGVPPYGETIRYVERVLTMYHARAGR